MMRKRANLSVVLAVVLAALLLTCAPAAAQSGSWWLGGATGDAKSAPAPQDSTISWWLGSSAEADTAANGGEVDPDKPTGQGPDYAQWSEVAKRAEEALLQEDTPNLTLERLRARLAEWRERFLAAQSANSTRIGTLQSQIAALGPLPEEGKTETDEIAARRANLNERLAELKAPGLTAEEAYLRADGMIGEIDKILRERQASELLELGPSPLVPLNWPIAFAAIAKVGTDIVTEVRDGWASETSRSNAREALPLTFVFLILGIALLARGRQWSEALAARFMRGSGRRAKRVVLSLLVSLGQVGLPFIGVILMITAANSTGLVGPRGNDVLDVLPTLTFAVLAARWLGQQVFAKNEESALLPGLEAKTRAEGRFYATLIGGFLALAGLLAALIPQSGATLIARVVLAFPIIVVVGIMLVRMGQILVAAARSDIDNDEPTTRVRLLELIGRGAILLGIAGPILAAIGYYSAGRFMVFPGALTLALLAFVVILQQLTTDFYALVTGHGDDEGESEALMPVLIGFALGLGALPVMALIWGARVSDLTELWAKVREGFTFGDTRIAPTDFITFAVVFAIGYVATRLVQGAMRTSVLPKTKIDPGGQNALVSGLGYLGIFLAGVMAITSAGIDLSSLAIVAGALSVGIGFGLQNIVSNFISGIILLVERPISEGDWIEVNGQMGHVRDISVRSTRIETFDRTDVIVPNSDLISGIVTNYTRGNLTGRIIVKVGVAYGTDTKRVEAVLREVAENHPMVTLNPEPAIFFIGFGADSLDFEIRAILRDVHFSMSAKSEMNHEIARRFAEEGFEIPFAQRDIWLRNPEVLTGANSATSVVESGTPTPAAKASTTMSAAAEPTLEDMPEGDEDQP